MNGDANRNEGLGRLVSAAFCLFGFGICLWAYFPGILSPDSLSSFSQAQKFSFQDWHSPIFSLIWAPLIRLSGGSQGVFVFYLSLYWGALWILARAATRVEPRVSASIPIVGFLPWTINFAGTLWADVLLAQCWLMAAALTFADDNRARRIVPMRILAGGLFLIGSWMRPNALFAAVPLGFYVFALSPRGVLRRTIVGALLLVGIWAGSWAISYPVLNATRTHPIHSIVTYDLAGISRFTGRNHFPLDLTDAEFSKVVACYSPQSWNPYISGDCRFVVARLKSTGLWGSSELWSAWRSALMFEPFAYLRHRAGHFEFFMTTIEYIFEDGFREEEQNDRLENNPAFRKIREYVLRNFNSLSFRPIFWLILAFACLLASRFCRATSRDFVRAVTLSSIVYLTTYFFVGVASNFRYAYWPVLGTSAAIGVLACELLSVRFRRAPAQAGDESKPHL